MYPFYEKEIVVVGQLPQDGANRQGNTRKIKVQAGGGRF